VAKVGMSNPDHTISLRRLQCIVENNYNISIYVQTDKYAISKYGMY